MYGASEICKLFIDDMLELNIELGDYIVNPDRVRPKISLPDMARSDSTKEMI